MGSDSDLPMMRGAIVILEQFGVTYSVTISSAHRLPQETARFASTAADAGYQVLIAAAGGAAHLAGVLAAHTVLPVIGVPAGGGALNGVDALYATVQMPKGIPVATVAIDGSANAALLAVEILALNDMVLGAALLNYRQQMASEVLAKAEKLQNLGVDAYLARK
jgi:5-(carboxyamino)imidazole ribonucleotide mutase